MTTKFFEEFTIKSKGEFPMLKLNSATYLKDKRELTVRFIISAFEVREFDDDKKAKVQSILNEMFAGVKVDVQYIRTYADEGVVKNKILDYFNRTNQIIFRSITDDNLNIVIDDSTIEITFTFDTPMYKMMIAGNSVEKLHDALDCLFNYEIEILIKENVQNPEDFNVEELHIDTVTTTVDTGLRLVETRVGEKIYARGKIDSISQMPNYIADINGACENIVLCGKISNIDKKKYKNKRFDPNNTKSGPEMLPMVKFWLDDTTSKIECVCFASKEEDADRILQLKEQSHIVCMGKVSWSQFSGAWSYMVSAIFEAEINFDSIHLSAKKPAPKEYTTIFPQEFVDTSQKSLLDTQKEEEINPYFLGKTFVVFDLETTDTKTDLAEIIELAALKIVDGKRTETFQSLIKPIGTISEVITNLTHISNTMVIDAPSIESVLPDFYKFVQGSILVGHNIAGFDYPIINRYAEKMGYGLDNELVDTLLLARKHLTELPNCKLETISKFYGISHENAHRAMSDVFATADALQIIAKRM